MDKNTQQFFDAILNERPATEAEIKQSEKSLLIEKAVHLHIGRGLGQKLVSGLKKKKKAEVVVPTEVATPPEEVKK